MSVIATLDAHLGFEAICVTAATEDAPPSAVAHATEAPPLFAMADADGGGAVARDSAVRALGAFFDALVWSSRADDAADAMRAAFDSVNRALRVRASHAHARRLGATSLVGLALVDGHAVIGHLGNVHAHVIRDGRSRIATKPPQSSTDALALGSMVTPDVTVHPLRPNDVFLITSHALGWVCEAPSFRLLPSHGAFASSLTRAIADLACEARISGAALAIHVRATPRQTARTPAGSLCLVPRSLREDFDA